MSLQHLDSNQFDEIIYDNAEPSLVIFSRESCTVCQGVVPILEDLQSKYDGKYNFYYVDVEEQKNLFQRFSLKGVPQILFFKEGEYQRQVVSAAGDGATAAVAAERYIEESNDFNENVLQSGKRVLLLFGNSLVDESFEFRKLLEEVNREMNDNYRIVEVDIATKKNFAEKYRIKKLPAVVVLDKGEEIKQLKYTLNKEQLRSQLS